MGSMQEILKMRDSGQIKNPYLRDWFKTPKPQEELYYTAKDPDEVNNLASTRSYAKKKAELKKVLFQWMEEIGDMGSIPEKEMVREQWWQGKAKPPLTKSPIIKKSQEGIELINQEPGASIGYRIFDDGIKDTTITRNMKSWDFAYIMGNKEVTTVTVPKPWKVYSGGTIPLKKGQTILVNAQRIGYRPTEKVFLYK